MQRPPPFVLTKPVWTTGVAPPGFTPPPQIPTNTYNSGAFGFPPGASRVVSKVTHTIATAKQEYQAKLTQLPQAIENELTATRLDGPTNPVPPVEGIARELGVINRLAVRKRAEFDNKTAIANSYYGYDPIDRPFPEILKKGVTLEKPFHANSLGMQAWTKSYKAAYDARLLSQTIHSLEQRYGNLVTILTALQAAEQARIAAEQQAQRIAAEQARIREEAEALAHAQEQARLAALAEAKRVAEEKARIAQEAQKEAQRLAAEAAARQVAAEQAQLATLAEAQRQAEQLRVEAERQEHEKQQAASAALRVYPAMGATASSSPVFSFASTAVILAPETSAAIITALRSALQVATAAGAATLGSVLIGFAALLTPSRLGNSERFTMSVPLAELTSESAQSLRAIADRQGTLDLPVGIGYRPIGSGAEVFVITADGFDIRPSVPVRHATFDAQNNVYRLSLPDSPTNTLTWTPAVTPGNSSTERPIVQADTPTYPGIPIVPLEGRLDLHPILVEGWDRSIIVFPDDSGIAPLYVVISSPYQGASVKGKYSGRLFNPELAGGPILDLDWRTAVITQTGIDAVKLHIARLDQSDANDIMVQRLEKILSQHGKVTDTDLRYYTHEIRELERYRAFGYSDTASPSDESQIWNNAHTATLEDYKLGSELTLLYSEEAISAMNAQDQREYEKDMRSFEQ